MLTQHRKSQFINIKTWEKFVKQIQLEEKIK